jgi:5-methylthioadenosine/S-adenosylhomocysteine deaminase
MYFFPDAAAAVTKQAGLRAQITFPILDFPTNWASEADDYIRKGLELIEQYRLDSSIQIGFGPHAPYTVSNEPLQRVRTLAEQLQAPIHIHAHETAFEVEQSIQQHGVRPLQRLFDLGVLGPLTQCVHMTQITQEDIELLQKSGASVVHCPESNLKLASGLCPVEQLLRAGVTVALGTDGAASNNDLDMFVELHTAALLGKVVANNASALNAAETLEMATLGGARALGMDAITGSLEKGKAADIIALDLSHVNQIPLYDLISSLVYNNRQSKVSHLWVDGRKLLQNGQLLTLDLNEIISRAKSWQNKIRPSQSPN